MDYNFGDLAPVDPACAAKIEWKIPIEESATGETNGTVNNDEKKKSKSSKEKEVEKRPTVRRWPRGPVKWVEREDGDLDLLAVGSEKGVLRREVVATLHLGDEDIGGGADPTGPLQGNRKRRAFPGGTVTVASSKENEARKDAEGEVGEAPPVYLEKAENESADNTRANGERVEGNSEPVLAAASSAEAMHETTAPVPLEAMATALPGETNGTKTKE